MLSELGEILPWVQYTPDKILNNRFKVTRVRTPVWRKVPLRPWSQVVREFVKEKPVPSGECKASLLQWTKKWYHLEPPPEASYTFIQHRQMVAGGTIVAGQLRATITVVPNLYTVPLDHRFYVRWVQVMLCDSDYESLFISLLDGQGRAHDLQSISETVNNPAGTPQAVNGKLLPMFPQDFHNILLAYDEGHTVGITFVNNHVARRIVWVGIWGWKMHKTCWDEYLSR